MNFVWPEWVFINMRKYAEYCPAFGISMDGALGFLWRLYETKPVAQY